MEPKHFLIGVMIFAVIGGGVFYAGGFLVDGAESVREDRPAVSGVFDGIRKAEEVAEEAKKNNKLLEEISQ